MTNQQTRVVVVGGGIAGLALGYHLMRRGVPVQVCEAGQRPGGNIRSEARDGYLCEWGPNGFLDNEPATLRLVDALGLRGELAVSSELTRIRWIVRDGRLRELPAKPPQFLTSDLLSLGGRLRVLCEWAQPARRDAGDESVFDFARRRIGREAAEVLVDAMVTGVYAGDARRLSLTAAFPRMRAMEQEHGGLVRAMFAVGRVRRAARRRGEDVGAGGSPMGPPGTLTSFTGGMETMVRSLARALGDNLICDARAGSITRDGSTWRIERSDGVTLTATHVVLACPSWSAAPLLGTLDGALAALVGEIDAAPVAVVCLGFAARDVEQVKPGFGFLVPGRERSGILGTLFDTWVFPQRSPAGRVLWRTMIGGSREPGAVDLDDAALLQRALEALEKYLGVRAAPAMTYIVRYARGIPQYPVGHPQQVERIEARLQQFPGLHLTGNSYHGISMNACIKEAEALAANLSP